VAKIKYTNRFHPRPLQVEDLVGKRSRWALLVCDWPHSVWTKSLVCKDAVLQGILLFRSFSEDSAVRKVGSLPAVRTTMPSCPDAHLSTVPSVRTPDGPSIIRLDDLYFYQDASQYSTKLQILSIFSYGKIDATVRTTWIPVRMRFSLRQELHFKFNRPDTSLPSSGRSCI